MNFILKFRPGIKFLKKPIWAEKWNRTLEETLQIGFSIILDWNNDSNDEIEVKWIWERSKAIG